MIFGESSQIKLHLQFMLYSTKFQAGSKVKWKNLNFKKKKNKKGSGEQGGGGRGGGDRRKRKKN